MFFWVFYAHTDQRKFEGEIQTVLIVNSNLSNVIYICILFISRKTNKTKYKRYVGGGGGKSYSQIKISDGQKKKFAKKQYVRVVSDQNTLIYRMLA